MTIGRLFLLFCLCVALPFGLACRGEKENTAEDTPRLKAGEAKAMAGLEAVNAQDGRCGPV
jgi:hypothetical protein